MQLESGSEILIRQLAEKNLTGSHPLRIASIVFEVIRRGSKKSLSRGGAEKIQPPEPTFYLQIMKNQSKFPRIKEFNFQGKQEKVCYVESIQVLEGVVCDGYIFKGDQGKDLGVIRIDRGHKTPLQRVLKGEKTVEGHISGKGRLILTRPDGEQKISKIGENSRAPFSVTVNIGDLMRWEAAADSDLVVYEICFPPYEDGRYENIS